MAKVIKFADGAKRLTVKRLTGSKKFRIKSIHISEATYNKNKVKYNKHPSNKVLITCNGLELERDKYNRLKTVQLPCSDFAKTIVANNKIREHTVTEDDIANCNHCDMLQWLVWWDESLLVKNGTLITLKDHPNCYVIREGVFNKDTCELAPPYVAIQKYLNLNILQTYYVCDAFLKHADKSAVRDYTIIRYGLGEMPSIDPTALNYIKRDNIWGVKPKAYATVFSILHDHFHISKEVIFDMMNREFMIIDSKYNICFLTYDNEDNVASVYKLSRYNHSDKDFCFNHYITKRNLGFVVCSEEAKQYDTFESLTVFSNPIELLSYITLEQESKPLVPSFLDAGCYMAIINSNAFAVSEWLDKHKETGTLNIALHFNCVNQYLTKALIKEATELKLPYIKELRNLVADYTNRAMEYNILSSLRVGGWNGLLNLYLDKLSAKFIPLKDYELKRYM